MGVFVAFTRTRANDVESFEAIATLNLQSTLAYTIQRTSKIIVGAKVTTEMYGAGWVTLLNSKIYGVALAGYTGRVLCRAWIPIYTGASRFMLLVTYNQSSFVWSR